MRTTFHRDDTKNFSPPPSFWLLTMPVDELAQVLEKIQLALQQQPLPPASLSTYADSRCISRAQFDAFLLAHGYSAEELQTMQRWEKMRTIAHLESAHHVRRA
jgi:hypothetical protein